MGTVYLGARADDVFEKQVAIKVVPGALVSDALRERFARERQLLAALDHPCIARIARRRRDRQRTAVPRDGVRRRRAHRRVLRRAPAGRRGAAAALPRGVSGRAVRARAG